MVFASWLWDLQSHSRIAKVGWIWAQQAKHNRTKAAGGGGTNTGDASRRQARMLQYKPMGNHCAVHDSSSFDIDAVHFDW